MYLYWFLFTTEEQEIFVLSFDFVVFYFRYREPSHENLDSRLL